MKSCNPRAPRRATSAAVQLPIPGLSRADKVAKPPKITEKALQAQTRRTLANLGYGSAEVGATRKQVTCPHCQEGFVPTGFQGTTVGYPDLSVFRYAPEFPPVGILIELKTDGGKPSEEQKQFAEQGRSQITYGIRETVEALIRAEDALSAYQTPPTRRKLLLDFLEMNKGRI